MTAASAGAQPEEPDGYPRQRREVGTPIDVEQDLDASFPQPDSLLPGLLPGSWSAAKEQLYTDYGLKVGLSYQTLAQYASDTRTGTDVGAGGILLFEMKWDAFRQGQDFEGSVAMAFDWRHRYGEIPPSDLALQIGSPFIATDANYLDLDPWVPALFWEQWLRMDRFVLRVGQQAANPLMDFFRFKDARVSFSNSQVTFPINIRPEAAPGFGVAFETWPILDSELYVIATFNDINARINDWDWSGLFETGELFAGFELGTKWKREGGEFDHVHVNFWYADEASRQPWPSESGWGMKLAGEKQLGRFVGFAQYSYNTARGGGFGLTNVEHAVSVGGGVLKPFGIRGEAMLGLLWARSLDGGGCGLLPCNGDDQWGTELYWRILVTPDLWITPGLQLVIDPPFNPSVDVVAIPQVKARLFF